MTQDSPKRYHPLQVTLHWLTVALVFAAFIFGKYSSFLPNDASKIAPLRIHMLLGITMLLVIIVRFVTRMKVPRPAYASTGNAFLDGFGKFVHYALYLLVFLLRVDFSPNHNRQPAKFQLFDLCFQIKRGMDKGKKRFMDFSVHVLKMVFKSVVVAT
jgi:cytochrome b561